MCLPVLWELPIYEYDGRQSILSTINTEMSSTFSALLVPRVWTCDLGFVLGTGGVNALDERNSGQPFRSVQQD